MVESRIVMANAYKLLRPSRPSKNGVNQPFLEFRADSAAGVGYHFMMNFSELLAELPALTVSERQMLVRRALELDDPALSEEDEAVVEPARTVMVVAVLHAARPDHHWQSRR